MITKIRTRHFDSVKGEVCGALEKDIKLERTCVRVQRSGQQWTALPKQRFGFKRWSAQRVGNFLHRPPSSQHHLDSNLNRFLELESPHSHNRVLDVPNRKFKITYRSIQ